jgi:uncharacterized protein YndB with AHSA1/START domain
VTERSVTHATFVVERSYDAAPARVFAAWADPAAKARWFASPEGASTRLVLTEQGAYLDGFDDTGERERGTAELLDALGAELRREPAGSR